MSTPKTIYLVTSGEYSDYQFHRAFSTEEAAIAWIGDLGKDEPSDGFVTNWYRIEECPLDDDSDRRRLGIYATIGLALADAAIECRRYEINDNELGTVGRMSSSGGPMLAAIFEGDDEGRVIKAMSEIRARFVALHGAVADPDDGGPGVRGAYAMDTLQLVG